MADGVERWGGDPPSPFERDVGYSRIVSAGGFVMIGGTTSIDPSGVVLGLGGYEQTIEILHKLEHEFGRVGCTLDDVIQLRVYVTDISRSEDVARAYAEVFADAARPLMTMVEVVGLIDPRMAVEIEAVAYRA